MSVVVGTFTVVVRGDNDYEPTEDQSWLYKQPEMCLLWGKGGSIYCSIISSVVPTTRTKTSKDGCLGYNSFGEKVK